MQELKKIWNFFKNLWKNKQTRAAAILLIYLIFISILVITIRTNDDYSNNDSSSNVEESENNKNNEYDKEDNQLKYYDNYIYDIEITLETLEKYKISNNIENQKKYYIFNTETNNYDIIDNIPNNIADIDLDYILYLINNTEIEYTTKYKDGTILNNYNIKLNNIQTNLNVKYNSENEILNMEFSLNTTKYLVTFMRQG